MIQNRRDRVICKLLLLPIVAIAWGCSGSQQQQQQNYEEDAAAMHDGGPMDHSGEAMPAPVIDMGPGLQDAGSAAEQKRAAYVEAFLNRATRLQEEGDLQGAKAEILKALNLDDRNADAKARLANINDLLGAGADPQDLAQQVINHRKAMRSRQLAEVNDRYLRATQSYNRGELEDAQRELEIAQSFIKYDAYQTDWGTVASDVDRLSGEVARQLEAQQTQREVQDYEDVYNNLRAEDRKERERREQTIRSMMVEAFTAFERQDFDHAEDIAQRVSDMAPNIRKAKDLVQFARQARHAEWRRVYYKKRREQIQIWKQQMRDLQTPWQDTLMFPSRERWDEITSLRSQRTALEADSSDNELVRTLKSRLANETVSWDFPDVSLSEVVQHIRDTQGINIMMSRATIDEKAEEAVNFSVRALNFGDALKTLLQPLELGFTFRHNSIYIVGKTEASGTIIPRVYDVRDLTINLPNFVPPSLHLRPGPAGESAQNAVFGRENDPVRETEPEQIQELVQQNVAPESWEIEGHRVDLSAGQLVAMTTPEIHRQIDNFLEEMRRFTKVIVHVETRFIAIREGFISEMGIDIRGGGGATPGSVALLDDVTNGLVNNSSNGFDNGGAGNVSQSPTAGAFFQKNNDIDIRARNENLFNRVLGNFLSSTGGATIGFQFLDDIELNVIFNAVEKSAFANVLTAPRLTIYNNQRANLTLVNQVSYVKDYDVEVAQTAFIADPLVDIVQDGLVLDVKPTVSHDRKYVTLEVRPTVAILGRPIQTFSTPLAGLTTNVIIELPEIEYRAAATTVTVPDNGWVVIGGLKSITTVDRRSEVPVLGQIPILSYFFSRKGRSDEMSDLMIVLNVKIIDLDEEEAKLSH
ncbi:MAG: hypothetical protein KDB53_18015 [Planctomycetes bacterium]|nr:hypothetical protein [Planctomycetota bacterium]